LLEGWRVGHAGDCVGKASPCSAAKEGVCRQMWEAIPKCGSNQVPCADAAPETWEAFEPICTYDTLKTAGRVTKWMERRLAECQAGACQVPAALEPIAMQSLAQSFLILAYQAQEDGPEKCPLRGSIAGRELADQVIKSSPPAATETRGELVAVQQALSRVISQGQLPAGLTATRCDVSQDAFASLYVACSCAGQASGLDKARFREGIASVLNMSADRIDGISSSPQAESVVVRFFVGGPGYRAQVAPPASDESCAVRWAVVVGLVLTVLLLAAATVLTRGVLCRRQTVQAEAGKSVVEVENPEAPVEMKTLKQTSPDAVCAPAEMQSLPRA